MPGILGKFYKGIRKDFDDPWQNSGFGLFAVSRLCGHEGKFLIISGDAALDLRAKGGKEYHDANFKGTAIRLNLSTKNMVNMKSTLATIIKEGDEIAKMFKQSDSIQSSAASRMLTSEFPAPTKK